MSKAPCIHRSLAPLFLAVLVLTGCGKGGCTSSSSSSFELNINGKKMSRKTITKTRDHVTRKLETTTDVELQNGQITKFPPLATIRLEESGSNQPREAELRENAGKLELWIKDNGGFRRSTATEDIWLGGFLNEITK